MTGGKDKRGMLKEKMTVSDEVLGGPSKGSDVCASLIMMLVVMVVVERSEAELSTPNLQEHKTVDRRNTMEALEGGGRKMGSGSSV